MGDEHKNIYRLNNEFLYNEQNYIGKIKIKIEVWFAEEDFGFSSTLSYANTVSVF